MSEDRPLKSAFELAMERLREQDRRTGVEERKPLTEEQKHRIAELRRKFEAKLAEVEIMHRDRLAAARGDPEKIREVEEHREIDRRRIESERESAIARVRRGESAEE